MQNVLSFKENVVGYGFLREALIVAQLICIHRMFHLWLGCHRFYCDANCYYGRSCCISAIIMEGEKGKERAREREGDYSTRWTVLDVLFSLERIACSHAISWLSLREQFLIEQMCICKLHPFCPVESSANRLSWLLNIFSYVNEKKNWSLIVEH